MRTTVFSFSFSPPSALLFLAVLLVIPMALKGADQPKAKVSGPPPKLLEIPSEKAKASAKVAVDALEAKSSKKGLMFDPDKLRACREIGRSLVNHPQLIEIRKQYSDLGKDVPPRPVSQEKMAQIEQAIWNKEKELILAQRPDLADFLAEREGVQQLLTESITRKDAPPGLTLSIMKELKDREEKAAKAKTQ